MRYRSLVVLLLLAFALAACGDAPTDQVEDGVGPPIGLPDADPDVDLPEGVAATVDGVDITVDEVEERTASTMASPAVATEIEEQGDAEDVERHVRAQTLSAMILYEILHAGAAELGVEPTEEDVARARAELVEMAGGEDELAAQLEAAGIAPERLEEELRALAALDLVADHLAAQAQEGTPEEQQQAAQIWLAERLAIAEVAVDPAYGRWDPSVAQVVPPTV